MLKHTIMRQILGLFVVFLNRKSKVINGENEGNGDQFVDNKIVVLTASSGQKTHLVELELNSSNCVVYSCGPTAEEVQLAVVNTNFSVLLDC